VLAPPVLPERAGPAIPSWGHRAPLAGAATAAAQAAPPQTAPSQTAVASAAPASAAPSVPAVPTSSAGAAAAAAEAGAQRASSAAGMGAATAAMSDRELEELARRLTRPLLRRLRQEVLLDRERAGLRTDRGWER